MSKKHDNVANRGVKGTNALGTSIWVGLRAIDPLFQRYLLLTGPLSSIAARYGIDATPASYSAGPIITTLGLNLTPYAAVVWGMSLGSAIKQIYWLLYCAKEPMDPGAAVGTAAFNTIFNVVNTLVFTLSASNPTISPAWVLVGGVLYTLGIIVEPLAETQRKLFKDKPENGGKAYAGGCFGLARNINYGAYTLWRAGYATVAGGPIWGLLVGSFFAYDFVTRGVPVLEDYCRERYGKQWERIEKTVPYRLFPGIY